MSVTPYFSLPRSGREGAHRRAIRAAMGSEGRRRESLPAPCLLKHLSLTFRTAQGRRADPSSPTAWERNT